jgi:hypothetical protein
MISTSVLHENVGTNDIIEVVILTLLVIFIIIIIWVKIQVFPPVVTNVSKDTNEEFSNYER